jgi:hypothetical protein
MIDNDCESLFTFQYVRNVLIKVDKNHIVDQLYVSYSYWYSL